VLDNLKEGVVKPDLYEPELNKVYAATLQHYGVVADPARVRDPNRKGSVENAIGHTQATALKGRRFESLEEHNAFLEHWETKWAAPRIHGRTPVSRPEWFTPLGLFGVWGRRTTHAAPARWSLLAAGQPVAQAPAAAFGHLRQGSGRGATRSPRPRPCGGR